MSKGFVTLGINTEVDRIKYCYGLALSIKNCDPETEVCLVVDKGKVDEVPKCDLVSHNNPRQEYRRRCIKRLGNNHDGFFSCAIGDHTATK